MKISFEHLSTGIAKRLTAARKKIGMSQAVVAAHLDISRPTLSEVETGKRRLSANEFIRLAHIYNVSLDWLAGKDEVLLPVTTDGVLDKPFN